MNEQGKNEQRKNEQGKGDQMSQQVLESKDTLESLFQHVATRKQPPREDELAIRESLEREWRAQTRIRRQRRVVGGFAIAASMILGVYLVVGLVNEPSVPAGLNITASVDVTVGESWKVAASDHGQRLSLAETPLRTGETVITGDDAMVSLTWVHGESIRLNQQTQLRLISNTRLELIAGQIYIDSHSELNPNGPGSARQNMPGDDIAVVTSAGTVRHIGTQYMVHLDQQRLDVSVREGQVAIERANKETIVHRGESAAVRPDETIVIITSPTHGSGWSWVEQLTPAFVMDGRSMADFLDWVASETGRQIHYRSGLARRTAAETQLHGRVDLDPLRALELVLTTSDLAYELDQDMITIAMR